MSLDKKRLIILDKSDLPHKYNYCNILTRSLSFDKLINYNHESGKITLNSQFSTSENINHQNNDHDQNNDLVNQLRLNQQIIKDKNIEIQSLELQLFDKNTKINELEDQASINQGILNDKKKIISLLEAEIITLKNKNQISEESLKRNLELKSDEINLLNQKLKIIEIFPLIEEIIDFHCPISLELFKNPVLAEDGFTYEESHLKKWIKQKKNEKKNLISPKTGAIMGQTYTKNNLVKNIIHSYKDKCSYLLSQDLRLNDLESKIEIKQKIKNDLEIQIEQIELKISDDQNKLDKMTKCCFGYLLFK